VDKVLQQKLFDKYPKLFRQASLSAIESPMGRGIEASTGWYDLIDTLCCRISNYVDWKQEQKTKYGNGDGMEQVEVAQVKSKFAGLRYYIDGGDDYVRGLVAMAEAMSYRICEECGSTKDVGRTRGGWIRTACKECAEKNGWKIAERDRQ